MEDKTKIETTPSIYQQPLEDNRKIKTVIINGRQNKNKTTPPSIYQQPLENNRKIKTALTTNNQWKTKQK